MTENGGEYGSGLREQVEQISQQVQALTQAVEEIQELLATANVTVGPLPLLLFLRSIEPGGTRAANFQQDPTGTIQTSGMSPQDQQLLLNVDVQGIEQQLKVETTRWIQIWVKAANT